MTARFTTMFSRRTLLLLPVAAACKTQRSSTVFVDPALTTLVPHDATFITGIRLQQLQSTPIYRRYFLERKLPAVERFAKNTGLDPRKDLWEFVIASDPRGTAALIRGRFSEMGMEPRLEREGARRFRYSGLAFVGDDRMAVAFLNPSTAIAGSMDALRYIADHRNEATGLPPRVEAKLRSIDSTNQIWFAGDLNTYLQRSTAADAGNMAALFRSMKFISGGIDLRNGMNMRASAETASRGDANRLRDAVRGAIGMARLTTSGENTNLLRFYDGIRAEAEGTDLRITINAGPELLDEVIRLSLPLMS